MTALDTQLVEVYGRNWLVNELFQAGWEVAFPVRDHGVDLIAYQDRRVGGFQAVPIQLKARSGEDFGVESKYAGTPGLLLVYLWNVDINEPMKTIALALTYYDAILLARKLRWTKTASWSKRGSYVQTQITERVRAALAPYHVRRQTWMGLLNTVARGRPVRPRGSLRL